MSSADKKLLIAFLKDLLVRLKRKDSSVIKDLESLINNLE